MPVISRRHLLTAASALPLVSVRTRPAPPSSATSWPPCRQSATDQRPARTRRRAHREATGGRVEISLFPEPARVRHRPARRCGTAGSSSSRSPLYPFHGGLRRGDHGVGFAFSRTAIRSGPAMDGASARRPRPDREARPRRLRRTVDNGFRQITSSVKPIKTPDDLKGYRIRVPACADLHVPVQGTRRQVRPRSTSTSSIRRCKRSWWTGRRTLVTVETGKLYEVQKYCLADKPHLGPFWLHRQPRAFTSFRRISAETLRTEFARAAIEQRRTTPISTSR